MADGMSHLHERAQAALALSVDERIERIRRPRWIGYTRAKQILDQLEDVLTHPKTHRMPGLLVVGDTNAGKTMLANRFEPVALPRWRMGQDFLRLLTSFERVLPLRQPSQLVAEPLARKLLALSEGNLGALVAL